MTKVFFDSHFANSHLCTFQFMEPVFLYFLQNFPNLRWH